MQLVSECSDGLRPCAGWRRVRQCGTGADELSESPKQHGHDEHPVKPQEKITMQNLYRLVALSLLVSAALIAQTQQYTIATFAGGAPPPTPIAAVKTAIFPNTGFAADNNGVYFSGSNCVFKVDVNGVMTRIAGNSRWGESPDGTPATAAEFSTVGSVAVDHAGTIYFVDTNAASVNAADTLVRKILPDGTIQTVIAGLQAGARDNIVRLAFDSQNNLYVIDDSFIRKVWADGTITTVAGNGTEVYSIDEVPAANAGIGIPSAIAVDNSGNIYIAAAVYDPDNDDNEHGRVRVVTPDGIIHAFVGTGVDGYSGDGGLASAAQIGSWLPSIAADGAGNVLIVDASNHVIRKVTPDGNITSLNTLDQSGCYLQGSGPYVCAGDLALDPSGQIYIVGQYNRGVIQRLGDDGSLTTIAGGGSVPIGDGGPAASALVGLPLGVAVDAAHNVYIGDLQNNRIRRVAPDGTITTVAGNGGPRLPGDPVTDGVPALSVPLACATTLSCKGIATDAAGNFYFTDNDRVRKVSAAGIITTVANVVAHGLASDGENIYIAAPFADQILKLAPDGTLTVVAGNGTYGHTGDGGPATGAQLFVPTDVAIDGGGNLFIAENYYTHIRKVTPNGIITTIAGGGNDGPDGSPAVSADLGPDIGITADGSGNVYVAEFEYDRIRKITPDGLITTIAGGVCRLSPNNPCAGYTGDGGPATNAQISAPARMAVDSSGAIYFSDSGNNAVRTLRPAQ
jgi:sugar lactone lactonase YvrE